MVVGAQLELIAMTRNQVADFAGISSARLDYWAKVGLVGPSIESRATVQRVRLYGHHDLLAVLIVVELLHRGMTLRHIGRVVRYVRQLGYSQPLTQVRYAVVGREIYFQREDGTWEGDRRPGQTVIEEVLDLEPLRARITRAAERPSQSLGNVERRRGALGSKEVFAGTRVPVATVQRYLDHGATVADVLEAYPMLSREDVRAVVRRTS